MPALLSSPQDILVAEFYAKAREPGLSFDLGKAGRGEAVTLHHIEVAPRSRGTGIASRALELLTRLADAHGVTLDLEVADEAGINTAAWYARHGFSWAAEGGFMERHPAIYES